MQIFITEAGMRTLGATDITAFDLEAPAVHPAQCSPFWWGARSSGSGPRAFGPGASGIQSGGGHPAGLRASAVGA